MAGELLAPGPGGLRGDDSHEGAMPIDEPDVDTATVMGSIVIGNVQDYLQL